MKRLLLLVGTHALVGIVGFVLGIYLLPILTAPAPPSASELSATLGEVEFEGEFRRDLADSDFLHWGEGKVLVSRSAVALDGEISPGPAYKLYLSPDFVETEVDFLRLRPQMAQVGDVKTFVNFVVPLPPSLDPGNFNTVVVWCESFDQFITAARYR